MVAVGEKETWKNVSRGKHFVNKFDRFGNKEQGMVAPGHTVTLTTEERELLNQEGCRDPKLDLFKNGILVPVKLVNEDDIRTMADNPNLLGESDLKALLKAHWKVQDAKISAITNGATLGRLRQLAIDEDVSVKTLRRIEDRIQEVDPSILAGVTEVETVGRVISTIGPDGPGGTPRPDALGGSPSSAPMNFKRQPNF